MKEALNIEKKWIVRKFDSYEEYEQGKEPFEISEIEGNLLLNEGINNVLLPLLGGTSSPTAFDEANANIGVGNDSTAEDAGQTGLQGTATYVGMETGYPSIGSQKITWRSVFDGSTGNHDWKEFTVANGSSNSADNLNRKVSDQGTKASGQTWTLDLEITFS